MARTAGFRGSKGDNAEGYLVISPKPVNEIRMRRLRRKIAIAVLIAIGAALVGGALFPVYRDSHVFCELTGSIKRQITVLHLISWETHTSSDLEKYLAAQHPETLRHRWNWNGATEKNLFGRPQHYECTFRPTHLLVRTVQHETFTRIRGEDKWTVARLLCSAAPRLEDAEKRTLYGELEQALVEDDLDVIHESITALFSRYCGADAEPTDRNGIRRE